MLPAASIWCPNFAVLQDISNEYLNENGVNLDKGASFYCSNLVTVTKILIGIFEVRKTSVRVPQRVEKADKYKDCFPSPHIGFKGSPYSNLLRFLRKVMCFVFRQGVIMANYQKIRAKPSWTFRGSFNSPKTNLPSSSLDSTCPQILLGIGIGHVTARELLRPVAGSQLYFIRLVNYKTPATIMRSEEGPYICQSDLLTCRVKRTLLSWRGRRRHTGTSFPKLGRIKEIEMDPTGLEQISYCEDKAGGDRGRRDANPAQSRTTI
ncbi:unnamed protein product [Enterobius vermicularis]|uniref:Reverse transcriptase domain-containing protein n=1 Tax=Enterobius vermicularis TaxID=51028 RepID=A0A0N4VI04_ENTVE|nr:unnamed protein product [Enterobius vermicularis]